MHSRILSCFAYYPTNNLNLKETGCRVAQTKGSNFCLFVPVLLTVCEIKKTNKQTTVHMCTA